MYIFMHCAPDPYEFFQSIFGLRALSKCVVILHIWTCCKVNSDQPSAAGVCSADPQRPKVIWQHRIIIAAAATAAADCYLCTEVYADLLHLIEECWRRDPSGTPAT